MVVTVFREVLALTSLVLFGRMLILWADLAALPV